VAGLRKMRHRGLLKIDWQFTLAMAAYDLVRLSNCSQRLFREPKHISNRAPLLPPAPICHRKNASASTMPTIAEAGTRQNQHSFSTLLGPPRVSG